MIDDSFSTMSEAAFDAIDYDLFMGVKESYGKSVTLKMFDIFLDHKDDAKKLTNLILPELKVVLVRQRWDYGLSEEFPAEYPIFDQAANVDDTPVYNLAMERL